MKSVYDGRVRELLTQVLEREIDEAVKEKEDLQLLGLDSLNCMSLIIELEMYFKIEIPQEKLGLSSVRSIHDICSLIELCLNSA